MITKEELQQLRLKVCLVVKSKKFIEAVMSPLREQSPTGTLRQSMYEVIRSELSHEECALLALQWLEEGMDTFFKDKQGQQTTTNNQRN